MHSKKIKHTDVASCVESMCLKPNRLYNKGMVHTKNGIYTYICVYAYHFIIMLSLEEKSVPSFRSGICFFL